MLNVAPIIKYSKENMNSLYYTVYGPSSLLLLSRLCPETPGWRIPQPHLSPTTFCLRPVDGNVLLPLGSSLASNTPALTSGSPSTAPISNNLLRNALISPDQDVSVSSCAEVWHAGLRGEQTAEPSGTWGAESAWARLGHIKACFIDTAGNSGPLFTSSS